jgi:hypothetical protein
MRTRLGWAFPTPSPRKVVTAVNGRLIRFIHGPRPGRSTGPSGSSASQVRGKAAWGSLEAFMARPGRPS